MFRKIAPLAALAAAMGLVLISIPTGAEEFKYREYEDALKASGEENKLVMIFFWADWCFYCGKIRKEVFSDPKIHEVFDRDFLAVSVDVTKDERDLAKKYNSRVLPTLTFLKPGGEIAGFWEGAADQETFLKIMEYLVKEFKAGEANP